MPRLGAGDGAQKRRVVVVVDPQAEPGAQVLDFGPVKKAGAARHLVRNVGLAQRLLERLGLVVGAVQDGEALPVRRRVAGGAQALDAGHGALGLVLLAVGIDHAHGLALAQLAEQGLGEQLGVGPDHVVGRAQDGAGGAVVLLQLDDLELGVVHRQFLEVVQRGAAPAVDGLVVVAHGGEVPALSPTSSLSSSYCVALVSWYSSTSTWPRAACHLARTSGKSRSRLAAACRSGRQSPRSGRPPGALHSAASAWRCCVRGRPWPGPGPAWRSQPHVFPLADHPLPLARRGGVGGAARGVLQDARHVVGWSRMLNWGLRPSTLPSSRTMRTPSAWKVHTSTSLAAFADQVPGALAHLGRRLVGEGDGRNALGLHALFDHVGDLHA
jgi:hypothetical protein